MATLKEIKLQGLDVDDGSEEAKEIYAQLTNLLTHTENMIPGSRAFGMNDEYLDDSLEELQNEFATDLYDKVDRFIPTIDIPEIKWDKIGDGAYRATIVIERKEE